MSGRLWPRVTKRSARGQIGRTGAPQSPAACSSQPREVAKQPAACSPVSGPLCLEAAGRRAVPPPAMRLTNAGCAIDPKSCPLQFFPLQPSHCLQGHSAMRLPQLLALALLLAAAAAAAAPDAASSKPESFEGEGLCFGVACWLSFRNCSHQWSLFGFDGSGALSLPQLDGRLGTVAGARTCACTA